MAAARPRCFTIPTEEQSATMVPEVTLAKKRGHQVSPHLLNAQAGIIIFELLRPS